MKRILSFCMLALALGAPVAHAQRIDSPYRFLDHGQQLGVHAGYAATSEGRLQAGPQPGTVFGLNWALRVGGAFAIGADVDYLSTVRTVRDTVFVSAESQFQAIGEADVQLLMIMANLRLNLTGARTWNALQPFVVLGAGVAIDLASSAPVEAQLPAAARFGTGTSFAGQFGAGVDWFATSRMSVRLDARNVLWKLSVPELFRVTEAGSEFGDSDWERNLLLTAGLSFHF